MIMDVIVIVLITVAALGFVSYAFLSALKRSLKRQEELSDKKGVYTGPAGEPRWYGTLPQKVDDYVCPRYVYENLVESTEFLPENGRIIGYRISPTLVIHSRVINEVGFRSISAYLVRLGGELLEVPDALCLQQNWEAVSALRQKAGDTPLSAPYFWTTKDGSIVAAHYKENACLEVRDGLLCALILKR